MIKLNAKAYRGGMSFVLWLSLISCIVGCAILSYLILYELFNYISAGLAIFAGVVVGFIIGLISNILWAGIISNFLYMVDKVDEIAAKCTK
jgi:hypothetical protein